MIVKNLFLNAGAMKAGTTWLYSILQKHPGLHFTYEKEIHFWSDYTCGTNALSQDNRITKAKQVLGNSHIKSNIRAYKRMTEWYSLFLEETLSLKWYTDLFSHNRGNKYNCDFSNLTCHMDEKGWELVKHVAENVKVIYIMRDPLARLWSHVKFHHQFIGKEIDFSTWSEADFLHFIEKKFIWENCEYASKIEMMQKCLPKESFKIFYFEDLVGNPEQYLRKLEDYLEIDNLDYSSQNLSKAVNVSKKIDMPDNFRIPALAKLNDEVEKLKALGINPHQSWTIK